MSIMKYWLGAATSTKACFCIQDAADLSVCVNFWGRAHDSHLLIDTSGRNGDVEGAASALENFGIV
jgi:hypothetical protein